MSAVGAAISIMGGIRLNLSIIMCLFVMSSISAKLIQPKTGLESSPLTMVQGIESGKVILPCDVNPPITSDDTILVLFYRGSFGTPIYSIDGRNGEFRSAKHFSEEKAFDDRAFLDMSLHPPSLVVKPLKASDQDEYRCRVDYRESPTRNVRIDLNVIVPPERMRIVTEKDVDVNGVIGPYPVGSSISLQCRVDGGVPRPKVTWWNDVNLLDDDNDDRRGETTINILTLTSLTRKDLHKVITCQASNSNLSSPLVSSVKLDLSFPPLNAKIYKKPKDRFLEGTTATLTCETSGSRPPAEITWWKNEFQMNGAKTQVYQEGNISRSTIHITPTLDDDKDVISCRAKNVQMPAAVMEDSTKLNVHYSPRLALSPGDNLDMRDIKEGDDVYFECGIRANPKVFKVQWFHNGDELVHNISIGVIQSNQSLVLQNVNRLSSGHYTCSASNHLGTGDSNSVSLRVKFAPLCQDGQKVIYGAGKNEEINVTCSAESHPTPTRFRWAFNSSSEITDLPPERVWMVGEGVSQVSYTPSTHLDYGSLLCWATNDVAAQKKPCIYHIIHAAVPEQVNNCTVENETSTGAEVICQAGWDGGLPQTFTLTVSHLRAHTRGQEYSDKKKKKGDAPRVLANTSSSPKPHFSLTGLLPGLEYVLTITGVNKKGQSEPVRLAIRTLKDNAERRTSPVVGAFQVKPIVAVILGIVASAMLISLIIIIFVVKIRKRHIQRMSEVKMVYEKPSGSQSPLRPTEATSESEEANPDIIPVNDDHQLKEVSQEFMVDVNREADSSQSQMNQQKAQQEFHPQLSKNDQRPLSEHHYNIHHDSQHDEPNDYMINKNDPSSNYYLRNQQPFLRQKAHGASFDDDPLRMGVHPVNHSPTHMRSGRPTTYPHIYSSNNALSSYLQGMSSTPTSPLTPATATNRNSMHNPYPHDVSSNYSPLPYQRPSQRPLSMYVPSYSPNIPATATLPRSHPRELPSSSSYVQGFASKPYAPNRLSLSRNDPLLLERVPSASSLVLRGSSSTVALNCEGDSPRTSVAVPRPLDDDSSERESSV